MGHRHHGKTRSARLRPYKKHYSTACHLSQFVRVPDWVPPNAHAVPPNAHALPPNAHLEIRLAIVSPGSHPIINPQPTVSRRVAAAVSGRLRVSHDPGQGLDRTIDPIVAHV